MTAQYLKAGFEQDIEKLPWYVKRWMEQYYPKFIDDISYKNDSWPTFHVCDIEEQGVKRPLVLSLSAVPSDGDDPGFYLRKANYDDESCDSFGIDGNEDFVSSSYSKYSATVKWFLMFELVEMYMKQDNRLN